MSSPLHPLDHVPRRVQALLTDEHPTLHVLLQVRKVAEEFFPAAAAHIPPDKGTFGTTQEPGEGGVRTR